MALRKQSPSNKARKLRSKALQNSLSPPSVSIEDTLPVFLTGSLPKRDSSAMYEFILCIRQLGINLPKDIYKMIYERLRLVALEQERVYYSRISSGPIALDLCYDFAVVKTETDGVLVFNDLQYRLTSNSTYFLFTGALRRLYVSILCSQFRIEYYSFIDRNSPVCHSIYSISGGLNSNIHTSTLLYLHESVQSNSDTLIRLPKEQFKIAIDVCIRHGVVSLDDKLKRKYDYWLDHYGITHINNEPSIHN